MNERVLIIEDDYFQSEQLTRWLARLRIDAHVISTEAEVCMQIGRDDFPSYSLAIVDMMLRWTDPSPDMVLPPPEIIQEGHFVAGLRCCRKLKARGVKCVIFTALRPSDIRLRLHQEDDFEIISKGTDGFAFISLAILRHIPRCYL